MSDLSAGLLALRDSRDHYEEAKSYSDGLAPEIFATGNLRRILRASSAKFRINWCRTTITAVLDRLTINSITCTGSPEYTAAIEKVWRDNNLGLVAPAIHDSTLTHGDSYVIVWEGREDGDVDIHRNSPTQVRVFYDPEDDRTVLFGIKTWTTSKKFQRVNVYYADRIERYISATESKTFKTDDSDFVPYFDSANGETEEDSVIENPYGKVPIFHFRTDYVNPRPEHFEAYGAQNLLNKIVVSHAAAMDYTSFPQRYALLEAQKLVGEDDPDLAFGDGDEEVDESGDGDLTSSPGSVWQMRGVKEVGQFDPANPENFLKPIEAYQHAMSTVTRTPMHMYELGGEPPSGESRRVLEMPLIKKIGNRQKSFAATWKELMAFALVIAGYNVASETIDVTWDPATSTDDLDLWDLVDKKVSAGVPQRVALMEAGYTKDQVDEWYPEGDSNQASLSIPQLQAVGSALAQFVDAVNAGIVSKEEVRLLLPGVFRVPTLLPSVTPVPVGVGNPAELTEAPSESPTLPTRNAS